MKTIKELEAEIEDMHNWRRHDRDIKIKTLKDVLKLIDEMIEHSCVMEYHDALRELKARISG